MDRDDIIVRRNDYINAIRSDLQEVRDSINSWESNVNSGEDLLCMCKGSRVMRRFRKAVKFDIKVSKWKIKMDKKHEKKLQRLLYKAEKYTPGSNMK